MRLHRAAHTVYKTQYHIIVWVTQFRRKVLVPGVQRDLRVKLEEVRKWYPDWEDVASGREVDHVHVPRVIPPRYAVSWVVGTIKQNTSRALSEKFAFLKQVYWDEDGIWTKGFSVSTVGINEGIIRRYVEMQGQEDAGQAQLEF